MSLLDVDVCIHNYRTLMNCIPLHPPSLSTILSLFHKNVVLNFGMLLLKSFGYIMQKLSPYIPLQLASDSLLRIFRARVHHHHQGQVIPCYFPWIGCPISDLIVTGVTTSELEVVTPVRTYPVLGNF